MSDVDNPSTPFMKNNIFQLSTSIYKSYFRDISEIRINTDKNLIFSDFNEIKTYNFGESRAEVDLKKENRLVPGSFSQMNFVTTGKTLIYYRNYRKLFDVIAHIGGFSNGIISIAYMLTYIYSQNLMNWKCIISLLSQDEVLEGLEKLNISEKNQMSNSNEIIIKKNIGRMMEKKKYNQKNNPVTHLQIKKNDANLEELR